jgi:hypothetical protein
MPAPTVSRATSRSGGGWAPALVAVLAAALPMLAVSDFTVDDAWVPVRYARSLAAGEGYRASAGAPVTDGVTPLGFAHLLVPFAKLGAQQAHGAARVLGVVAWLGAAGALGATIARLGGSRARFFALALVATSSPVAAWALAGLETGLVTALLATALVSRERGRAHVGAVVSGVAAGWRPELLPAVVVLAFAAVPPEIDATRSEARPLSRSIRVVLAVAPALLVAALRFTIFGRAAPLSVLAKTPILALGVSYAGAAALLAGYAAIVAPRGLRRTDGWTRALALAAVAHVAAMAFAGGDWMPLARLAVPVVPVVVLASARIMAAPTKPAILAGLPCAIAVAFQVFGFSRALPAVAIIERDRAALIREMKPVLEGARTIAAVDVGWLSVAAEHARIVDLAGITDPTVAAIPGGHTSKRLPRTFFKDRDVDTIVLLLGKSDEGGDVPWPERRYGRGTEAWIASIPEMRDAYEVAFTSATRTRYVVLRRVRVPEIPPPPEPQEPGGMW